MPDSTQTLMKTTMLSRNAADRVRRTHSTVSAPTIGVVKPRRMTDWKKMSGISA